MRVSVGFGCQNSGHFLIMLHASLKTKETAESSMNLLREVGGVFTANRSAPRKS